ncbi:MAG: signal peptidase I [Spirochaetales bacterium]|nr:signal peptidase I [Spirochaetales bacterium]
MDYQSVQSRKTEWKLILFTLVLALGMAFLIRLTVHSFFFFPLKVTTDSLQGQLHSESTVFILRGNENLKRQDAILVKHPLSGQYELLLQLVGLPGDEIEARGQEVRINGRPIAAKTTILRPIAGKLAENEFYALSLKSEDSMDSTGLGPFPGEGIVGRVRK